MLVHVRVLRLRVGRAVLTAEELLLGGVGVLLVLVEPLVLLDPHLCFDRLSARQLTLVELVRGGGGQVSERLPPTDPPAVQQQTECEHEHEGNGGDHGGDPRQLGDRVRDKGNVQLVQLDLEGLAERTEALGVETGDLDRVDLVRRHAVDNQGDAGQVRLDRVVHGCTVAADPDLKVTNTN